ncbi:MAG: radical SAM protein [bacterium]|nr:MAG: radical SAM protein [bacterium]
MKNREKRKEFKEKEGFFPPFCVSFAPTSRCNLSCDHCSSSGLEIEDIDPGLMMRVMREARDDMGVHFFVMTGGEPFVYEKLFTVIESFPDCYFQIFTNGTLLTEDTVRRLEKVGNALIMLSLEGLKEPTDLRRNKGTFDAVENAMQRLKAAGVPFGFSVMMTSENCESITSEEFIDWSMEQGCLVGYIFHYMPIGSDSDFSLLPKPQQRDYSRKMVYRWRNEKPIFLIDLINDGPLTGGCTSSGRHYLHILSTGDVVPCVYCNFSTQNIKEVTLAEALKSPYLSTLRKAIPFEGNALRPCFLLDRPAFYFRMLELFHPHSCVPGEAERIKALKPKLKSYANQVKEIYNEAWEKGEWESVIRSVNWCIGD